MAHYLKATLSLLFFYIKVFAHLVVMKAWSFLFPLYLFLAVAGRLSEIHLFVVLKLWGTRV